MKANGERYLAIEARKPEEAKVQKRMKAVNIQWDTDDEDALASLPDSILIPEDVLNSNDEDAISDYLSEQTGFCHYGYNLIEADEETEGSTSETAMYDGVTTCCGYDFGVDQFDARIQFCPCCGRKIIKKE